MGFFDDLKENIDDARDRRDERRAAKQERKEAKAEKKDARKQAKIDLKEKKRQERREDRKEFGEKFTKFVGEQNPLAQVTGIFKKDGKGTLKKPSLPSLGGNLTKVAVIAGVGLVAVVMLK